MAYDQATAERVRRALKRFRGVSEKKMFGGLAFLWRGNMCCGVVGSELMVRVGPEAYEGVLTERHVRKMDFTGKPLRGFVYVEPRGFASERDLEAWIGRATTFARSLPAK